MTIIEQIKAEVERLKIQEPQSAEADGYNMAIADVLSIIEESRAPEPFFYCKYGGTIPKCSDCKRNHSNSKYKTEEIHNWYSPEMRGAKMCSCYVPIEKSSNDLEEAIKEAEEFAEGEWDGLRDNDGNALYTEDMIRYTFVEAVKWHKEQMMKEAAEGAITNAGGEFGYDVAAFRFDDNHTYSVLLPHEEKRKYGDKVKLIIVKEE